MQEDGISLSGRPRVRLGVRVRGMVGAPAVRLRAGGGVAPRCHLAPRASAGAWSAAAG